MRLKDLYTLVVKRGNDFEFGGHQRGKAAVNLWGSLQAGVHGRIEDFLPEYGCEGVLQTYGRDDVPRRRSPHDAANYGNNLGQHDLDDLPAFLEDRAEVFTTLSPDGTGMLAQYAAKPFQSVPLERVTKFLVVDPEPTDKQKVLRAFNFATLDWDRHNYVFLSKASSDELPEYLKKIAKIQMGCVFLDSQNLFTSAAIHRRVEAGSLDPLIQTVENSIREMVYELGSHPSELIGFNPEDVVIEDSELDGIDIWKNAHRAHVITPPRYNEADVVNGLLSDAEDIDVHAESAPISDVQILVTRELSEEFLSTVRTTWIQWLHRNASDVDAWVKEVNGMSTGPEEEVVRFLTRELNVNHPDVMDALRGVGADV